MPPGARAGLPGWRGGPRQDVPARRGGARWCPGAGQRHGRVLDVRPTGRPNHLPGRNRRHKRRVGRRRGRPAVPVVCTAPREGGGARVKWGLLLGLLAVPLLLVLISDHASATCTNSAHPNANVCKGFSAIGTTTGGIASGR